MIKDQCNNCMKQMNMTCTHQIIFNGSPCQDYAKRFDLVKHKEKEIHPVGEIRSVATNPSLATQPITATSEVSFFKSLFSFKGRIRRTRYWLTNICVVLLMTPYSLAEDSSEELSSVLAIYILLTIIPYIWIIFGNIVKRLHDLGKSGWLMPLSYIPIFGQLFNLYIAFAKGQECDNEYGPNPY